MTTERPSTAEPDIAVIGGGLVGSSIAYGLSRAGARVVLLDEGDVAHRASRGNFALVWLQSKGSGMPEYAGWTKASTERWRALAAHLREETGIDVAHHQPGGFSFCLSDTEMQNRIDTMRRLHNQPAMVSYPYEVLDHEETKRRLPAIGPDVVGSIFCPLDGHVNSLRLFRALHTAMKGRGVDYRPLHPVESIAAESGAFKLAGPWGSLTVPKIVLAAGLGNARLGPQVGLDVPVRPSKGQVIVTEKAARFLDYPTVTIRQTDEGGVMIGDSMEEAGFDTVVTTPVVSLMAQRAMRIFPQLAGLNVVRTWSALRVMSQDGFPIYDQSLRCPGAFVVTCHSGVTLAANHVLDLADHIVAGVLPPTLSCFSSRRFHVPSAA